MEDQPHGATVVRSVEVADRRQRQRLLEWAAPFMPRVWAVEGATGTGALLAQQLVAAGEEVLDVPPTLSARVRLLDCGRSDKTDSHDARAAAVVALRHRALRPVRAEDHVAMLRLLAKRHHDLVAARTRAVCRLHTTLCYLAEGHFPKRMKASQAAAILAASVPPARCRRSARPSPVTYSPRSAAPTETWPNSASGSGLPSPRPAPRSPTCSASAPSLLPT
jgi:transposase